MVKAADVTAAFGEANILPPMKRRTWPITSQVDLSLSAEKMALQAELVGSLKLTGLQVATEHDIAPYMTVS